MWQCELIDFVCAEHFIWHILCITVSFLQNGCTCLHIMSLISSHTEVIRLLLRNKAFVNERNHVRLCVFLVLVLFCILVG
jgi:hypothetical protein